MTSAFSTNDTENVSRQTEHVISVGNLNEIWDEHRLDECVKWIELGECKKVSISSKSCTIFFIHFHNENCSINFISIGLFAIFGRLDSI